MADVYSDKEQANEWDGYKESLRYLAILYILSQSDALVASTECGATIFAEGYSEKPFEFVDIYGKKLPQQSHPKSYGTPMQASPKRAA